LHSYLRNGQGFQASWKSHLGRGSLPALSMARWFCKKNCWGLNSECLVVLYLEWNMAGCCSQFTRGQSLETRLFAWHFRHQHLSWFLTSPLFLCTAF
jgi:hypothetical protein